MIIKPATPGSPSQAISVADWRRQHLGGNSVSNGNPPNFTDANSIGIGATAASLPQAGNPAADSLPPAELQRRQALCSACKEWDSRWPRCLSVLCKVCPKDPRREQPWTRLSSCPEGIW